MKHYRVYKLDGPSGQILKGKDMHATDDAQAMHDACEDPDCPVCEIWQGRRKIGTVDE